MSSTASDLGLRQCLLERKSRLQNALHTNGPSSTLNDLMCQVDGVLGQIDDGNFGRCELCHGPIDGTRVLADPLTRVCLECYTPEQARELERDLETAAQIQSALLPRPHFRFGDWGATYSRQPAGPVSGDHVDLIESSGRLYFLFGDVAGKGVSASLLTAHLHALFRSLLTLSLPLQDLLVRANRLFSESTLPNSYATLIFGYLTPDGQVELANAGHCPPLWARPDGVGTLSPTGLPFGLFSDSTFETHRFQLGVPEALVFYTDGVTEAPNEAGVEYGLQRLSHLVDRTRLSPAGSILGAVRKDLGNYQNGSTRADDSTLMVVKREFP